MATLGDLVIKMSLDAAGFQSDMGKAAYQAEKGMAKIVAAGNIAASAITGFAVAAVKAMGDLATSMPDIAKQVQAQADAMSESAAAAGIATQAYQGLQAAAALGGVTSEQFATSMNKLNKAIVDAAEGQPKMEAAFSRLGVSVTDANGKLRTTEDVFTDLNKAFGEFPEGPEKASLAMELFGKSGAQMAAAMSVSLQELSESAREVGAIFSDELLAASDDYEAASKRLDESLQGVRNTIAEGMLPAMTAAMNAIDNLARSFLGVKDRADAVIELREKAFGFFKDLAYGAAFAVDVFVTLRDILATITDAVIVQVAAWNVLDRAMHLDWEGVKAGLASVKTELELLTLNLQKRLEREPLRFKVEAEFAKSEAQMREAAFEAALPQGPLYGETGTTVARKPGQAVKDNADKQARELEAAERRLLKVQENAAREAQRQHQKELDEMLKAWDEEAKAMEAADKRLQKLTEKNAEELRRQHEKELDEMLRQMEEAKAVREGYEEIFTGSLADAFVDIVEGTKSVGEAFEDMAKSIAHSITQIVAKQLATQAVEGLFGSSADAGGIWGAMATMFGPNRAFGGPFHAGQAIKVGERGPEYIRPGFGGRIEPMSGGSNVNNSVAVNVSVPPMTDRRSADQIGASVGLAVNRALRRTQ